MEKRRSALEAYRASKRAGDSSSGLVPAVPSQTQALTSAPTPARNKRLMPDNPAAYAAQKCDNWMAVGNVLQVVEYYKFLESPSQKRRVLTWAVEKARVGDLQALLGIGLDDPDPAIRKHLNDLLRGLSVDKLLSRITEGEFTIKERRTIPGLLGRCKSPEAGKLLAAMADHADSGVRASAMQALARYPFRSDLQLPIFKYRIQKDSSPDVKLRAAEGLARIGTPEAMSALEVAAGMENASREIQAVLAGCQAKKRGTRDHDSEVMEAAKEKKPFPTAAVMKALFAIIIIGGTLWRLWPVFSRIFR